MAGEWQGKVAAGGRSLDAHSSSSLIVSAQMEISASMTLAKACR